MDDLLNNLKIASSFQDTQSPRVDYPYCVMDRVRTNRRPTRDIIPTGYINLNSPKAHNISKFTQRHQNSSQDIRNTVNQKTNYNFQADSVLFKAVRQLLLKGNSARRSWLPEPCSILNYFLYKFSNLLHHFHCSILHKSRIFFQFSTFIFLQYKT